MVESSVQSKIYGHSVLPDHYYRTPYFAQFLLFECPGKCDFCIVHGRGPAPKRKILPANEILGFWNNIAHREGTALSLLGGEPTIHPEFLDIINNLEGYRTTFTSNLGTPFYQPSILSKIRYPERLRLNTSFHPHFISVDRFITNMKMARDAGLSFGQLDMIYHPEVDYEFYKEEFAKRGVVLGYAPFLGFYKDGKWPGSFDPANRLLDYGPDELSPGKKRDDWAYLKKKCGIKNYKRFQTQCGASIPQTVKCSHHTKCLLVSSDGKIYDCHYKLYYDKDSYTDIWHVDKLRDLPLEKECNWFGFCNWCDIVRANFSITGDNVPRETAKC